MERRLASRPQRVLLVDDSADLRALWKLWLMFWGFGVEEARNGAEAVEKARTHLPDLVLMDLAMPVLDGRAAISCWHRIPPPRTSRCLACPPRSSSMTGQERTGFA